MLINFESLWHSKAFVLVLVELIQKQLSNLNSKMEFDQKTWGSYVPSWGLQSATRKCILIV